MTAVADTITARAQSPAGELDVVLYGSLAAAEADWRFIEDHGVLTPYQRFDWVRCLIASGAETPEGLAIATIRRDDRPVALLPLVVERRWGLALGRMLGAPHSNSDWLALLPGFTPDPATLHALFGRIAQAAGGIDLLSFSNQPAQWAGRTNPVLALDKAPAASNLYAATIGPVPAPYIDHRLTNKRRSNIKRGARRLEELHGPLRLVRVADSATLDKVHRIFLDQRGERFTEMGVRNIFAEPAFVSFFRQLTIESFGQRRPAMCLHALYAGDTVVATCWGAMAGNHYSQYINSTASGPAAKYSLTAVMIAELMDELNREGITTFDMGLGDFDYKIEWTEPQPVFHSMVPLTARGRLGAVVIARRAALKRLIKQTPALWQAARWLRLQLRRLADRT